MAIAVALAVLALAACSDGEGPGAVQPASETAIEATTAAPAVEPSPEATAETATTVVASGDDVDTDSTGSDDRQEGRSRDRGETILAGRPTPTPPTLPTVEFPDDVALLAREYPYTHLGRDGLKSSELLRVYKRSDDLVVREVLFSDADIEGYVLKYAVTPDASTIVVNTCIGSCTGVYVPADGRTAFYQSRDGGVTWEHLVSFDEAWNIAALLPGDLDETRLLLHNANSFDYMIWPGGLSITPPDLPEGHNILGVVLLSDGRIAWGMNNYTAALTIFLAEDGEDITELVLEQLTPECPGCSTAKRWSSLGRWYFYGGGTMALEISDGFYIIGWDDWTAEYSLDQLAEAADPPEAETGDRVYWPTIRNSNTLEQWPIRLPADVLTLGNMLLPAAVQQGPFLRVVDVGEGCLPIVAEASLEAEELACAAERVLLTDLGGMAEEASRSHVYDIERMTWRKVKTPAGIEGWADSRHLE